MEPVIKVQPRNLTAIQNDKKKHDDIIKNIPEVSKEPVKKLPENTTDKENILSEKVTENTNKIQPPPVTNEIDDDDIDEI